MGCNEAFILQISAKRLAVLVALFAGCTKQPQGGPRMPTSPVSGVVQIDGQASDLIIVECHPDPEQSELKYPISAVTDAQGNFAFTTYENKDGLPAGRYSLTFKWMEASLAPKDRLKGAYSDPKKSEQSFIVEASRGEKIDLGVIELNTSVSTPK